METSEPEDLPQFQESCDNFLMRYAVNFIPEAWDDRSVAACRMKIPESRRQLNFCTFRVTSCRNSDTCDSITHGSWSNQWKHLIYPPTMSILIFVRNSLLLTTLCSIEVPPTSLYFYSWEFNPENGASVTVATSTDSKRYSLSTLRIMEPKMKSVKSELPDSCRRGRNSKTPWHSAANHIVNVP